MIGLYTNVHAKFKEYSGIYLLCLCFEKNHAMDWVRFLSEYIIETPDCANLR